MAFCGWLMSLSIMSFMSEYTIVLYLPHLVSPVDGNLSFYFLAIMNNAAIELTLVLCK